MSSDYSSLPHNTCKYCGGNFGGEASLNVCFRCWEIFEGEGGPQADPETHPRATAWTADEENDSE